MTEKIMIRAFFDWHEVTREKALSFARYCYRDRLFPKDRKAEFVNKKCLKGISFTDEELRQKD